MKKVPEVITVLIMLNITPRNFTVRYLRQFVYFYGNVYFYERNGATVFYSFIENGL